MVIAGIGWLVLTGRWRLLAAAYYIFVLAVAAGWWPLSLLLPSLPIVGAMYHVRATYMLYSGPQKLDRAIR